MIHVARKPWQRDSINAGNIRAPMPWQKMLFRNDPVWIHVSDDGRPILDAQGRAEMKYRETDTKTYRPGPANLTPIAGSPLKPDLPSDGTARALPADAQKKAAGRQDNGTARASESRNADDSALQIWTDGACSGNPGPMGIGMVVIDGAWRKESGEYLGVGTNNIAELVAIERGLELAIERLGTTKRVVRVHSDSSYAIGLLEKGWKAKANQELVVRIRGKLRAYPAAIQFVKVAGHAGVRENERCDELARQAVERRASVG
jgi:ribonuclease HI